MTFHKFRSPIDTFYFLFLLKGLSQGSITFLTFLIHFCDCIKASVFSNVIQFNFVQQDAYNSTRINSSMCIHTSVFVSFETYPIFNNDFFSLRQGWLHESGL